MQKYLPKIQDVNMTLCQQLPPDYAQTSMATNDSVIMLLAGNEDFAVMAFGIFILGGFTLASSVSIMFSLFIYHTLRSNASCFTPKKYGLHRQLILLLIVQVRLLLLADN
jgi:hypothetical protein